MKRLGLLIVSLAWSPLRGISLWKASDTLWLPDRDLNYVIDTFHFFPLLTQLQTTGTRSPLLSYVKRAEHPDYLSGKLHASLSFMTTSLMLQTLLQQ